MALDPQLNYQWQCPDCQTDNWDNYGTTIFPLCSHCSRTFTWGDVCRPGDHPRLNELYARFILNIHTKGGDTQ